MEREGAREMLGGPWVRWAVACCDEWKRSSRASTGQSSGGCFRSSQHATAHLAHGPPSGPQPSSSIGPEP